MLSTYVHLEIFNLIEKKVDAKLNIILMCFE